MCDTKTCRKCHVEKPISQFNKGQNRDKHHSYCKACAIQVSRDWYKAHPKPRRTKPKPLTSEQAREYNRLAVARCRAKKRAARQHDPTTYLQVWTIDTSMF
jgi:hypothetical protein